MTDPLDATIAQRDALEEKVADLENQLSSMVSVRDITIRDLKAEVGALRTTLHATQELVEEAVLPARWVVAHADRAHEYDRPYAKEALRWMEKALECIRKATKVSGGPR